MRILVVEDDKKIASFIVSGLKQNGFAVDHCADGQEAFFMVTNTDYDAAIVDIMLPRLDGLKVVDNNNVVFAVNKNNKPAVMKHPEDGSYFYILMPIKTV